MSINSARRAAGIGDRVVMIADVLEALVRDPRVDDAQVRLAESWVHEKGKGVVHNQEADLFVKVNATDHGASGRGIPSGVTALATLALNGEYVTKVVLNEAAPWALVDIVKRATE